MIYPANIRDHTTLAVTAGDYSTYAMVCAHRNKAPAAERAAELGMRSTLEAGEAAERGAGRGRTEELAAKQFPPPQAGRMPSHRLQLPQVIALCVIVAVAAATAMLATAGALALAA